MTRLDYFFRYVHKAHDKWLEQTSIFIWLCTRRLCWLHTAKVRPIFSILAAVFKIYVRKNALLCGAMGFLRNLQKYTTNVKKKTLKGRREEERKNTRLYKAHRKTSTSSGLHAFHFTMFCILILSFLIPYRMWNIPAIEITITTMPIICATSSRDTLRIFSHFFSFVLFVPLYFSLSSFFQFNSLLLLLLLTLCILCVTVLFGFRMRFFVVVECSCDSSRFWFRFHFILLLRFTCICLLMGRSFILIYRKCMRKGINKK